MVTLDASQNPTVSILILSQDNLEMLGDCLASVARTVSRSRTPYEVLLLFQQTSRQSAATFLAGVKGARDWHARLNLGFGAGNNFHARHAIAKYLVFLNEMRSRSSGGWRRWCILRISTKTSAR